MLLHSTIWNLDPSTDTRTTVSRLKDYGRQQARPLSNRRTINIWRLPPWKWQQPPDRTMNGSARQQPLLPHLPCPAHATARPRATLAAAYHSPLFTARLQHSSRLAAAPYMRATCPAMTAKSVTARWRIKADRRKTWRRSEATWRRSSGGMAEGRAARENSGGIAAFVVTRGWQSTSGNGRAMNRITGQVTGLTLPGGVVGRTRAHGPATTCQFTWRTIHWSLLPGLSPSTWVGAPGHCTGRCARARMPRTFTRCLRAAPAALGCLSLVHALYPLPCLPRAWVVWFFYSCWFKHMPNNNGERWHFPIPQTSNQH